MVANPKKNLRRQNTDGSFSPVCIDGFAAAARTQIGRDLTDRGNAYLCDSAFLAERGILTRPESTRQSGAVKPRAHTL